MITRLDEHSHKKNKRKKKKKNKIYEEKENTLKKCIQMINHK